MTKRILISGSRNWTNVDDMTTALKEAYLRFKPEEVVLVSGNAKGADAIAEKLWEKFVKAGRIERHPAVDYPHPLKRNDAMVELGADICLAFVLPCAKEGCIAEKGFHYSHGTMYTYEKAKDAGIESILVYDTDTPPF